MEYKVTLMVLRSGRYWMEVGATSGDMMDIGSWSNSFQNKIICAGEDGSASIAAC